MSRDSRRIDANGNFRPPRKATVVKPVEKKKFVTGGLGTYELDDHPLASGNYAEVFKARETTTGAISVCKVINLRRRSFSDEERQSIKTEIDILSLMQHENIITYVDHHHTPDRVYIFSELAHGTTLVEYYRDNNNYVTERDARHIFRQICSAVDYMHNHGIIHRDIKSENIMIDERLKVMLIDFGLARRATGPKALTSLCGTVSYMAPEIDAGEESNGYTTNVDIWSLGILLFRMLVGEYPFDSDLYDKADKKGTDDAHSTSSGSKIDFTRDWRPFVDTQSKRSVEVKYLLESILNIDPSRRARMDQILSSDWMRMTDKIVSNFDIEHSGSTRILKSNDVSDSSDSPAQAPQARQEPWGELRILPGGFRDAPRRIELTKPFHVLGRIDDKVADILLGTNRAISVKHCIIERGDDGVIMMSNTSLNGTYINNLKLIRRRSGQLFHGDVLGIAVCPGHLASPSDEIAGCHHCLKYEVILKGAQNPTPDDLARRMYKDHLHRGHKKRRPEDRVVDENDIVWGILKPVSVWTEMEELQGIRTTIGRDKDSDIVITSPYVSRRHCAIEWAPDERKAYITNDATNATEVNNEQFQGRLQLRNNDEIKLVSKAWDRSNKESITVGYKFNYMIKDDTTPAKKRVKSAPVDIPEPVLVFDTTMSPGGKEHQDEQANVEEERKVEENKKAESKNNVDEEPASHEHPHQEAD
ncbi:hypothetical protein EMPS_05527 [Entomortierella parvispora]|uniref:Serine/threonine-protein kinase RAD53 n=1 Tax=Entomortierella parvispora TaxID=205924 RepID=A0A9P3HAH5_9FUNG|nr:hypothetical protein EMPS_05527 [Entomortierella parvispora]